MYLAVRVKLALSGMAFDVQRAERDITNQLQELKTAKDVMQIKSLLI